MFQKSWKDPEESSRSFSTPKTTSVNECLEFLIHCLQPFSLWEKKVFQCRVKHGSTFYNTFLLSMWKLTEREISYMFYHENSVLFSTAYEMGTCSMLVYLLLIRCRTHLDFLIIFSGCHHWKKKIPLTLSNTFMIRIRTKSTQKLLYKFFCHRRW